MKDELMPNEIVNFKIAKLAKEAGYSGNIGFGYRGGDYYVERTGELNGHCLMTKEAVQELKAKGIKGFRNFLEPLISAPTQRRLKYWLKETHNIYIEVLIDRTSVPKWCFEAFKYQDFGQYFKIEPQIWFLYRTEELALEAALELVLTTLLAPPLNETGNTN